MALPKGRILAIKIHCTILCLWIHTKEIYWKVNLTKRVPIDRKIEFARSKNKETSFQKFFGLRERNDIPIIQMVAGSDLDEEILKEAKIAWPKVIC